MSTSTHPPRLLGAILAGGQAQRFGSDKAMAVWQGKPLIGHVVAALERQTERVIVCGRAWPDRFSVPDHPHADMGPLGGLNAALHYAEENGFDAVVSAGCDTPVLPDDLAMQLNHLPRAAILETMPVIGLWPVRFATALNAHLAAGGDRSIRRWSYTIDAVKVALEITLPNINTTMDLGRLNGL